jgi:type I restriction enzyme S subunit
MPAIDAEIGAITKPEVKPLKKVIKGYTHFTEGDILFAKITPCMENGKAAIAKNLVNGVGCGTTELHVLRPLGGILSEYIYHYIRQQSFRDRAEANMTGTAGQLRVPVEFIRNEIIPLPPLEEQKEIINKIRDFFTQADTIEKSVKIAQAHCEKLSQSILAKAFRGELVEQDPNDEPTSELLKHIEKYGK